jgi:hypothetical protein
MHHLGDGPRQASNERQPAQKRYEDRSGPNGKPRPDFKEE